MDLGFPSALFGAVEDHRTAAPTFACSVGLSEDRVVIALLDIVDDCFNGRVRRLGWTYFLESGPIARRTWQSTGHRNSPQPSSADEYHVIIFGSAFLNSGTGRRVVYFLCSIRWDISETPSIQRGVVDQRALDDAKGLRTLYNRERTICIPYHPLMAW